MWFRNELSSLAEVSLYNDMVDLYSGSWRNGSLRAPTVNVGSGVVIVCYIHIFADITSFAGQVPCIACGPRLSHSRSPLLPFPHYTCVQNMNYFQMRCSKFAFTYKSQLTLNTAVNGSYAVRYGHWSARQAACVVRNQDFRRVYSVRGVASLIPW